MDRPLRHLLVCTLIGSLLGTGCQPTQPFFIHEDGDLSHYLDSATDIEYPDVQSDPLPDAAQAQEPYTLLNSKTGKPWNLSLEEAVSIALANSKVIRSIAQVRQTRQAGQGVAGPPETLALNAEFTPSIYDPAIQETGPNGVEAALSVFDAQFSTNLFWDRTDRPQNVNNSSDPAFIFARILERDNMNSQTEVTKRTANGTQWSFRNITTYDASNRPLRVLASEWLTSFEAEARQPLMRGFGTQVNRIPVILARMRTDVSLAQFEASIRNFLAETERAYWDVYLFYRILEARKVGRDSALLTWKRINAMYEEGGEGGSGENEAQAREQYYFFRGRVEEAMRDLLIAERQLRFLMGISPSDGRLIRPTDEPTLARVTFDWSDILTEALTRSNEIRRQKWNVKQRELELVASKNNLLPQVDLVALYRWVGLGDDLVEADRNGLDFPNPGSTAFDSLTGGRFQEWRLGVDVQFPIGLRAEHSAVRSQQLQLAREKARLEDLELETSHSLTDAIQRLDANYALAQTAFLQRAAAQRQVEVLQSKLEAGTITLDLLLDAQRRAADAEIAFYQSLVQYNLSILEVHFRKGSLLAYSGVMLQEGPWPAKAYFDALIRARQRDASHYFDYGYTRPGVVSRGPLSDASESMLSRVTNGAAKNDVPTPADAGGSEEPIPAGEPTPAEIPSEGIPSDGDESEHLPAPAESASEIRFKRSEPLAASAGPELKAPAQAESGTGFKEREPQDASQPAATQAKRPFVWDDLFQQ